MKGNLVKNRFSSVVLRFSLLFVFLVLGGEGILSEENTNPGFRLGPLINRTDEIIVKPGFRDFCVFMPGTYYLDQYIFSISRESVPQPKFHLKNLKIMGTGKSSPFMMAEFLESHNPKISKAKALKIAHIYVQEADKEGVNYDVAFSQMCLETGFLKYGGYVKPQQNNFCGLGVTDGMHGLSFPSVRIGIRAHIQHLKAYATKARIKDPVVDTRLRFVNRGSIKTIAGLSGKWAMDKHYSVKICSIISRLYQEKSN